MSIRTRLVFLFALTQVLPAFTTPMSPSSSAELDEKRSFYIDPAGNSPFKPWPYSALVYCHEGEGFSNEFQDLLSEAWVLWVNAFGGSQKSSLSTTLTGPCKNDEDGSNLHVTLTNNRYASTTIGFQGKGLPAKNRMFFDLDSSWGFNNAAANLAHELGHAFGLAHEHQKWSAWHPDLLGGRLTPLVKLNCENLKDYDAKKQAGNDMKKLCSSQGEAARAGFTAADMLSYSYITSYQQSPDFDWNSIMLYGSDAGAKAVNGSRKQPTLVKYDGSVITPNLKPSEEDGKAIRELYPKQG